jgi:hypothetical protein
MCSKMDFCTETCSKMCSKMDFCTETCSKMCSKMDLCTETCSKMDFCTKRVVKSVVKWISVQKRVVKMCSKMDFCTKRVVKWQKCVVKYKKMSGARFVSGRHVFVGGANETWPCLGHVSKTKHGPFSFPETRERVNLCSKNCNPWKSETCRRKCAIETCPGNTRTCQFV